MFDSVIQEFYRLPQVEAIALGGSRSGSHYDEKSDYDIYLYCTAPVGEEERSRILNKYCSRLELSNHFWELEDNGTFLNGIDFDILYRNLEDFTQTVSRTVEEFQPQNAYTTCMWHNLITSKILCDKQGRLTDAQKRFSVPYPEALRENILENGIRLLQDSMPAYEQQIIKAARRGDLISVNHRVAAFLETYFDVIFAVNRVTHPGEKRLMQLSTERCRILPDHYEKNIHNLLSHMFTDPDAVAADLQNILKELKKIL